MQPWSHQRCKCQHWHITLWTVLRKQMDFSMIHFWLFRFLSVNMIKSICFLRGSNYLNQIHLSNSSQWSGAQGNSFDQIEIQIHQKQMQIYSPKRTLAPGRRFGGIQIHQNTNTNALTTKIWGLRNEIWPNANTNTDTPKYKYKCTHHKDLWLEEWDSVVAEIEGDQVEVLEHLVVVAD